MKTIKIVLGILAIVAMTGCYSAKVVTDIDKTVDFSNYETYSFLGWQENSGTLLNDMAKDRVRSAFINEFEARGLKGVESNGDMEITLYLVVDQKTSVTAYTDYYGGGGGYGGYNRYNGGWGYGHSSTSYSESDYLEGTLVMDVFDGSSKDQVWQAVMTATVTEDPSKQEKSTPKRINALMRDFPVRPVK